MNSKRSDHIKASKEKIIDDAISLSQSLTKAVPKLCHNCKLVIRENMVEDQTPTHSMFWLETQELLDPNKKVLRHKQERRGSA
jgi:ribosomal protein L36